LYRKGHIRQEEPASKPLKRKKRTEGARNADNKSMTWNWGSPGNRNDMGAEMAHWETKHWGRHKLDTPTARAEKKIMRKGRW